MLARRPAFLIRAFKTESKAQIEREQSLVNANRELFAIYEQKFKDEINKL